MILSRVIHYTPKLRQHRIYLVIYIYIYIYRTMKWCCIQFHVYLCDSGWRWILDCTTGQGCGTGLHKRRDTFTIQCLSYNFMLSFSYRWFPLRTNSSVQFQSTWAPRMPRMYIMYKRRDLTKFWGFNDPMQSISHPILQQSHSNILRLVASWALE